MKWGRERQILYDLTHIQNLKEKKNNNNTCRKSIHSTFRESSRKTSTTALLTTPKPLTVWITTNWKICKEMGTPDHLTCLLRNLYAVMKQQLEPDMDQQTGSKLGKEYIKPVYCHSAYLIYAQCRLCKVLGWMNHQLGSRLLGVISIISDTQIKPPLRQKVKRK